MYWYYREFCHHPVAADWYETEGRNTIPSNCHYRIDTNLGKGVCEICHIPCVFPYCVAQLDKELLIHCFPSYQPRYAFV